MLGTVTTKLVLFKEYIYLFIRETESHTEYAMYWFAS